jgi:hypothetical protein
MDATTPGRFDASSSVAAFESHNATTFARPDIATPGRWLARAIFPDPMIRIPISRITAV